MARDAYGWMEPPGDPDVAGQPAEFVDLEPNLPGAGAQPADRLVLILDPPQRAAATIRASSMPWRWARASSTS
jgi:hypothetical protein